MKTNGDHDQHTLTHERTIMKEWNYLQQSLFNFVPTALHAPLATRRQAFQQYIARITETRARIWWEVYPEGNKAIGSRLLEMCHQQICYGILELTNGYLESALIPGLPQHFANLCALLLYTAEHEKFVAYRLAQFPPFIAKGARISLTPREKDVLSGLMRDESEKEMALRLRVAETTIHTHLRRLYTTLNVDNGQQAIFRAFELRLIDWLDMPEGRENSQE
ncbi:MAG TPA: LuxR C-terminal-related transcriptional regulator [Ktedonobacteraceae bacterium]|nr:LuxR C-terminal-related transcriptional regulator [Ktedonobacteraceae bacterium]